MRTTERDPLAVLVTVRPESGVGYIEAQSLDTTSTLGGKGGPNKTPASRVYRLRTPAEAPLPGFLYGSFSGSAGIRAVLAHSPKQTRIL